MTEWTHQDDWWRYFRGAEEAFIDQQLSKNTYKDVINGTDLEPEEVKLFASKYLGNRKGYFTRTTSKGFRYHPPYEKEGKIFDNLNLKIVALHLLGTMNLAVLSHPKTTKHICIDIDTQDKGIVHAVRSAIGYPTLISRSYKSGK